MRIKFLSFGGEGVLRQQWGRFKRREDSILAVIGIAVLLHLVFWLIWGFGVAPYPTAFSIPLPFELGYFSFLRDFLWPLTITGFLAINTYLIFLVYKKDIFASWLLMGANILLQILVLAITLYLVSFVTV